MKRILLLALAVLMLIPCLQIAGTAANEQKLWATVGDNDTHLLPRDYEKTLKKYNDGKLTQVRSWSGWAWKNDHANSRLDFFVQQEAIPQAQLVTADLVSASGAVIKKENITATYLAKVNTLSENYPDIDYEVFDIITHKNVMDLAAGQLHEAWVDIYVPKDAAAGTYRTTIALKSGAQTLAEFTYELEVVDMTLTDPENWETFLDLWTYPYATNRYYSGKTNAEYFRFTTPEDADTNPNSLYYVRLDKKYEAGLESELELFHQAGGNTITVTIVEDPWNSRKPCACPSMVKWTKKTDGTFTYDYTDMDYWIELNMKHGINRQINLYSLAGVGWGFVYYDEASGTVQNDSGGHPGAARWKQISYDFLVDLIAHLEEKGWFDIACLYMDEREYDWTRALIEVAESVENSEGKTLKVGGAVNGDKVAPLYDRLYDIAIWENALPDDIAELSEARRANGQQTIVYTCGAGKMSTPNQPAEAAYAVYESYKNKTDGILRWALNKYDEDPLHATLHYVVYPGDCYMIYPDEKDSPTMQAQSSPRYEKMCEGMRNVEKLRILRKDYPEYADVVDSIAAAVGTSSMVNEATRMRTRILSLSRAVISLTQGQYTDLSEDKWFMDAARFVITNGLMQGVTNTEFAPDASMTRAMFVTVLARLDGAKLDNNAASIFNDVPSGQWYTGAIVWATKNGLVTGVAPDTFAPDAKLTREQTATLLFRYATRKKYDITSRADLSGYKDSNRIGSFAVDAISWANSKGIIKGISADTLDPTGNCTRAQVAQMLRLFCQNVVDQ